MLPVHWAPKPLRCSRCTNAPGAPCLGPTYRHETATSHQNSRAGAPPPRGNPEAAAIRSETAPRQGPQGNHEATEAPVHWGRREARVGPRAPPVQKVLVGWQRETLHRPHQLSDPVAKRGALAVSHDVLRHALGEPTVHLEREREPRALVRERLNAPRGARELDAHDVVAHGRRGVLDGVAVGGDHAVAVVVLAVVPAGLPWLRWSLR